MANLPCLPPEGTERRRRRLRRLRRKKPHQSPSYLNQLLARVFISFAIVWSFFTMKSTGPPLDEYENNLFLRRGVNRNEDTLDASSEVISVTNGGADGKINQAPPSTTLNTTPPKAAFILVATQSLVDPIRSMSGAIESILEHTDRDRILCILPIFRKSLLMKYGLVASEVIEYFTELDMSGSIIHKHGNMKHVHKSNNRWIKDGMKNDKLPDKTFVHSTTVRVFIENDISSGGQRGENMGGEIKFTNTSVGESRRNAAQFVQSFHQEYINQQKHQQQHEEIILTFLRPDSQIQNDDWLEVVTDALVGSVPPPPPLNQNHDKEDLQSFHFNNAVSFALSRESRQQQHMADRKSPHHHFHHHYSHDYMYHHNPKHKYATTSLDINLQPIHTTTPLRSDITLTNGRSYPTPILEGSATSLLLSTYLNLPLFNHNLTSTVAADIELSFNLWLCGSGIDVITELQVEKDVTLMQSERDYVSYEEKVLLVRDWMSDEIIGSDEGDNNQQSKTGNYVPKELRSIGEKILFRLNNNTTEFLFKGMKEAEAEVEEIESQYESHRDKRTQCRTFDWFTKEVNVALGKQLHHFDQFIEEERIKSKSESVERRAID